MSSRMRALYVLMLASALLLTLGAGNYARSAEARGPNGRAVGLMGVTALALVLGWLVVAGPRQLATVEAMASNRRTPRRLPWGIAQLAHRPLFFALLLASLIASGITIYATTVPVLEGWPKLVPWVASLALYAIAVATLPAWPAKRIRGSRQPPGYAVPRPWELAVVGALTLAGLLIRISAVGEVPYNVHGDEGEMGLVARAVLSGDMRNPFATAWQDVPTLWFFVQALGLRVFGDNLTGLRLVSALVGTATIPATYLLGRLAFGPRTGLISAALLAAYHFHVHYSRIGLSNVADSLTMAASLAALLVGFGKRWPLAFAVCGIIMGVAQYFYFSVRTIPIVVVLALLLATGLRRARAGFFVRSVALILFGAALAVAPLARYYTVKPATFLYKFSGRSLFQQNRLAALAESDQGLRAALTKHATQSLTYFVAINELGQFYDPGTPLLSGGMQVFFLLGLVLAATHRRRFAGLVMLIWVGTVLVFMGFALADPPASQRFVIVAPALCILTALGLDGVGRGVHEVVSSPGWLGTAVVAVISVALFTWNLHFYFSVYSPRSSYANTRVLTEIARYVEPRAHQSYVHLSAAPYFYLRHGTISFIGNQPAGRDLDPGLSDPSDLEGVSAGLRPLFIVLPDRLDMLEVIREAFPGGQLKAMGHGMDGGPSWYVYEPSAQGN